MRELHGFVIFGEVVLSLKGGWSVVVRLHYWVSLLQTTSAQLLPSEPVVPVVLGHCPVQEVVSLVIVFSSGHLCSSSSKRRNS